MTLKIYNTATRRKEIFRPLEARKVGIYVCGVTVYDLCHIGHARSAIVFDVLAKYLRAKGFEVTYVRNFTDVDDKIIARARELGKKPGQLAQEYIDAFYEDMDPLGVDRADIEPRATQHIDGMIRMVADLLERGYAYVADEDVYFSVEKFEGYGRLSGRKLEDMQAGSRIAVDDKKRHPMDFALWKGAKPGEPQWPSPWGPGRPGWHLECSVMSNHYLGSSFDIHGGGRDLLFPHHENERAQSVGANGGIFANYWVHNGFVTVESDKMSKSLGNFLTIREALKIYHPEVLRLFLLSKHYRSPLDFSRAAVLGLRSGLIRIYRSLQRIEDRVGPNPGVSEQKPGTGSNGNQFSLEGIAAGPFMEGFERFMDDDLNTAGAVGLIFEKVKQMNKKMGPANDRLDEAARVGLVRDRRQLLAAGSILGLFQRSPTAFFSELRGSGGQMDTGQIESLIEKRAASRARKDWKEADRIRDLLKEAGIVLEDGPGGTSWRPDV